MSVAKLHLNLPVIPLGSPKLLNLLAAIGDGGICE